VSLDLGEMGKPCLCPCPPLCQAIFSETAQEVGLHNVRIQEAIGLLKATSCELVIHIHLSPAIRPFGPCHCLHRLQKAGSRQQRLLDTECAIVQDWQHPTGWGGKWWVRKGTPAPHCHSLHNRAGGWGPLLLMGA
jgi:hypothetical protein